MPESPPRGAGVQRGVGSGGFDSSARGLGSSPPGFRPVGGGSGGAPTSLLSAFEGLVTTMAAQQRESERATKEVVASTERVALLLGGVMDRASTLMMMSGAMSAEQGVVGRRPYVPRGVAPMGLTGVSYLGPNSTVPGPAAVPGAPSSQVPPTGGPGGGPPSSAVPQSSPRWSPPPTSGGPSQSGYPEGGPPGPSWPGSFAEGRGESIGEIRQNAARALQRRMSEWGTGGVQVYREENGRFASRRVPSGSPTWAADVVGQSPGWRAKGVGTVKNVVGNLAEGDGVGQALMRAGGLAKVAGVAGMAYMGTNMALDYAEAQRAKNMEFQSVLGGANTEGFKERMRQNVFRLSMRGTMGGRDAEEIYKSAMDNYGTDGASRGRYQDAAIELYRNSGLGASESTRLLNLSASQGNDNLLEFANAIREVGQAARDAGESAADARKMFEEGFTSSQGFATGSTQIGAARQMADVRIGLGDQFSDASFAGMDSPMNLRRMAQNTGRSYPDFIAQTAGDQVGGSLLVAEGRQSLIRNAVVNVDRTGNLFNTAQARFKERFGNKPVTEAQINTMASELMSEFQVDPTVLAMNLRGMAGVDVSDADAMPMFLRMAFGDVNFAEAEQERLTALTQTVRPGMRAQGYNGKEYTIGGSAKNGARLMGTSKNELSDTEEGVTFNRDMTSFLRDQFLMDEGSQKHQFEHGFNEDSGKGPFKANRSMKDRVRNSILNSTMDTGVYNSMGRAIWDKLDQFEGGKFIVETKDGPRAVDAYDLVENYSDQLQANPEKIEVVGGKNSGRTVGQIIGVQAGDASIKPTSQKTGEVKGKSVEEARKEAEREAGKSTGRIDIVAEPWLRQFFQFNGSGSAYNSYQYGVPPEASHSTPPEERRTGGG